MMLIMRMQKRRLIFSRHIFQQIGLDARFPNKKESRILMYECTLTYYSIHVPLIIMM